MEEPPAASDAAVAGLPSCYRQVQRGPERTTPDQHPNMVALDHQDPASAQPPGLARATQNCYHNSAQQSSTRAPRPATQPVPMAPFSPITAHQSAPMHPAYLQTPAYTSNNEGQYYSGQAMNAWSWGYSPHASNYSPMQSYAPPQQCAPPPYYMQQAQPPQEPYQPPHSVRDMHHGARQPQPRERWPARRTAQEGEQYDHEYAEWSDDEGSGESGSSAGGSFPSQLDEEQAARRASLHAFKAETEKMRLKLERERLEIERERIQLERLEVQRRSPNSYVCNSCGSAPSMAPSSSPSVFPRARPATYNFSAVDTPPPPISVGRKSFAQAIAEAQGGKPKRARWNDLPRSAASRQTQLSEDTTRAWIATHMQNCESSCPGITEYCRMDAVQVHAMLEDYSAPESDIVREMNSWLARNTAPLLDQTEGTRSGRLVKEMLTKSEFFLQSGWHIMDVITKASSPKKRANRVALKKKLERSYFNVGMTTEKLSRPHAPPSRSIGSSRSRASATTLSTSASSFSQRRRRSYRRG